MDRMARCAQPCPSIPRLAGLLFNGLEGMTLLKVVHNERFIITQECFPVSMIHEISINRSS